MSSSLCTKKRFLNDNVKMNIYTLLFFCIISSSHSGFFNSWKKIKALASKSHKTRNKELNFLGYDKSEYPGINEEYLKLNEEKWNDYYQCLQEQHNSLGKYETLAPEALLGFEGNYVSMDCKICISPLKKKSIDSIEWRWAPEHKQYLEPIELTENIVISLEDKTLHMYNLELENSGQYICKLGDTLNTPYFLTVIRTLDSEMSEVHSPNGTVGPFPQNPQTIPDQNLVLDTEWSQWSTCSKCNAVGKRHKLGYCSIYLKKLEEPELTELQNGTVENFGEDTNIIQLDLELFIIFKFGIPCQSHILPKVFKELPIIKQRKNEIMIGYCREQCVKNSIFEVRNKDGKVIEQANNSEGIYSMLQPLPPLEPPVHRTLQYGVKGKRVILHCPGTMNSDTPIHWQVGDKSLIPELISKESHGRIFISITDRIQIKDARISDSNIYSCWQKSELAGTVRLIVEKKFEMNLLQHIMLLGIVVILGVFLWVFAKAIAGRKFAKM